MKTIYKTKEKSYMAKFFRIIVNLCIIGFLLTGVALIVPQFVGITTVIVDQDISDTNVNLGSVVYGRTVSLDKLEAGDKLLRSTNTSVFVDKITSVDAGTGQYTVEDSDGTSEDVTLRSKGEKVLVTVPFIGYASIAMQTLEGRIILGLALAFLIILFILSEIWKSSEEDDEEDDDDEEDVDGEEDFESGEETVKLSRRERKVRKKAEKRRRKKAKKRLEEEAEEEQAEQETEVPEAVEELPGEENFEAEELILEPADELEEEPVEEALEQVNQVSAEEDEFTAAIQAALENGIEQNSLEEKREDMMQQSPETEYEPSVSAEPKKMAMPALTVEELLEKAHEDGDDPNVIEDEEDGISLVDYSDVL